MHCSSFLHWRVALVLISHLFLWTLGARIPHDPTISSVEKWNEFHGTLKTGDLYLLSSNSNSGRAIKLFTWSEYSHVGMIVVLKFHKDSGEWDIVPEQDGNNTRLAAVEVGNQDLYDLITGDRFHGFQVASFSEKFVRSNSDGSITENSEKSSVTHVHIYPLKKTVGEIELKKMRSIIACLHVVRTRFLRGTAHGRLVKAWARYNGNTFDLLQMFCSEFVALVAYELGWITEDTSIQNVLPKNFSDGFGNVWSYDHVHMTSSDTVRDFYVGTEKRSDFGPLEAARYEGELRACDISGLSRISAKDRDAFSAFEERLTQEVHEQVVWAGVVDYTRVGRTVTLRRTFRFVARVDKEGRRKSALLYVGGVSDEWRPSSELERHVLDIHSNDLSRNYISFKRDGKRSKYKVEGRGVQHAMKALREWSTSRDPMKIIHARVQRIFVFPLNDIRALQLPSDKYHVKEFPQEGVARVVRKTLRSDLH
eukprot:TRINITY_DN25627_c0_g1_i1.p1 TRINITY_DN25627_c0_g1~~TRINITY_DN25627_c0_g1_i1.p1  ORF type:complete len:480 (+),score=43.37 TRINITY_DN25627_c0_g1_i1:32-1471(+)